MRALTATLVVVCVFEWWVDRDHEGLFTRTASQRAADMVALPAPVVQIYGDSVSDSALDETILEQGMNLPSGGLQNFSIPGTTAFCAFPLLARQVAAGKVPKVIVLAYNPRSYTVPLPEKFLGRFATWEEMGDAWRLGVSPEGLLQALACRVSFSLRYRQELNGILRSGAGWEFFDESKTPVETLAERRARMAAPLPAGSQRVSARDFNPDFHSAPFRYSEEIHRSLDAFFDLARRHAIQVLIVSMPDPPGAHAYRESNGFNRAYQAFLNDLAQRHGAKLILPENVVLPTADFSDAVHLSRQAGRTFSGRVRSALLRELHTVVR